MDFQSQIVTSNQAADSNTAQTSLAWHLWLGVPDARPDWALYRSAPMLQLGPAKLPSIVPAVEDSGTELSLSLRLHLPSPALTSHNQRFKPNIRAPQYLLIPQ